MERTYCNYRERNVSKTAFFHMSEEEEYGDNWIYYKDEEMKGKKVNRI